MVTAPINTRWCLAGAGQDRGFGDTKRASKGKYPNTPLLPDRCFLTARKENVSSRVLQTCSAQAGHSQDICKTHPRK